MVARTSAFEAFRRFIRTISHPTPIGSKTGTGGSEGVEYLKRTLFQPVFPDLWAVRHRF